MELNHISKMLRCEHVVVALVVQSSVNYSHEFHLLQRQGIYFVAVSLGLIRLRRPGFLLIAEFLREEGADAHESRDA